MKKLITIFAVVVMILAVSSVVQASTVINFDAVALRPANDGSGYGTITEYVNGNGATVSTLKDGQKVYYGTDYFNGWALSSIDYLEFTYEKTGTLGSAPYSNVVITDGTNYGIISSQGGYSTSSTDPVTNVTTTTIKYYFAGKNGNSDNNYNFKFYEPSPDGGSWATGTNLTWSQISSWSLLGVGATRPLYSGETLLGNPQARGPVTDGLTIMWGDSLGNYVGDREIYNVKVYATNGDDYVAGVPEPATMAILGLGGLLLGRKK